MQPTPSKRQPSSARNGTHLPRIAIVFPGQGSQSVGMLSELAQTYDHVPKTFAQASEALGFDLWEICQDEARLGETQYTQPALLTASVAIWRILQDELGWHNLEQKTPVDLLEADSKVAQTPMPVCFAGHSLGEYSALCASGALSLATAVQLVHRRGELMTEAVADVPSKMLAVLGLEDQQVVSLCEQVQAQFDTAVVSVANFNSAGQVVVAGNEVGVEALHQQVTSMGKRAVVLGVSVPSHCQLMQPVSEKLAKALRMAKIELPKIPVIQNRHAKAEHSKQEIETALVEQLSHPVLWSQTMQNMADKHVDMLIECGAGTVLSNLAKRQTKPVPCYPTDKPARLQKLLEVL